MERIGGIDPRLGAEDLVDGPDPDGADTSAVWSEWDKGEVVRAFDVGPVSQGPPPLVPYHMAVGQPESWVYIIGGDLRLLSFRGSDAIGQYDATTLASYPAYSPGAWLQLSGTLQVYHDAGALIADRLEHPLRGAVPTLPTCWKPIQAAIVRARADADSAVHNDTDAPPILFPWAFNSAMFALGRASDQTGEALVVVAIGGDSLHAELSHDGGVVYPVHLRVSAWNHKTDRTVLVDTTRMIATRRPLAPGERLVLSQSIPLGAGDWEIALLATEENLQSGAYTLRRDVRVDRGPGVTLSDLVTGVTGAPSWIAPDGNPFPINVAATWTRGSSIELFYEVGGVEAGGSYRTTVEDHPARAGPRAVASHCHRRPEHGANELRAPRRRHRQTRSRDLPDDGDHPGRGWQSRGESHHDVHARRARRSTLSLPAARSGRATPSRASGAAPRMSWPATATLHGASVSDEAESLSDSGTPFLGIAQRVPFPGSAVRAKLLPRLTLAAAVRGMTIANQRGAGCSTGATRFEESSLDIARPPKKKTGRYILWGVGAIVLLAIMWGVRQLKPAAPSLDRSAAIIDSVRRGDMVREVRGPGTLVPVDIIQVPAQTGARIDKLEVQSGQVVKANDVLLEMSSPDAEIQAIQADQSLSQAQSALITTRSQLRQQILTEQNTVATTNTAYVQAIQNAAAAGYPGAAWTGGQLRCRQRSRVGRRTDRTAQEREAAPHHHAGVGRLAGLRAGDERQGTEGHRGLLPRQAGNR